MPESVAIALMKNCTAPWRSLDSHHRRQSKDSFHTDTQEQIQRCFHCTKSECDNCIGRKHMTRLEIAKEIFCKYFYEGLSRTIICSKMGISRATYYRYQKLFILPKGE